MIRMNVNVDIDTSRISGDIERAVNKAQFALDEQILKDSNYYIPKDTSQLENSGVLHSQIGQGKIVWNTPYARRLYYNPQYNFSKDRNPNAQGLWFEAAKAANIADWKRIAQSTFDDNF